MYVVKYINDQHRNLGRGTEHWQMYQPAAYSCLLVTVMARLWHSQLVTKEFTNFKYQLSARLSAIPGTVPSIQVPGCCNVTCIMLTKLVCSLHAAGD